MGIHGRGNRGWKSLQKGLRDPLFCEQCEQHFNTYCEQPFYKQWIDAAPLPDPWPAGDRIHWITVDYSSFKLFHLSVLFRASVSQKPTFAAVSLGPHHEEKVRQLILKQDPGKPPSVSSLRRRARSSRDSLH